MTAFDNYFTQDSARERLLRGFSSLWPFGRQALNSTSVVTMVQSDRAAPRPRLENSDAAGALSLTDTAATSISTEVSQGDLSWLEEAASSRAAYSVADILEAVDWAMHRPGEIAIGIRLALLFQADSLARELAAMGYQRYPEHGELSKMQRILAPPLVTVARPANRPDMKADLEWLRSHRDMYQGQWVALRDGHLLAVSDSAKELVAQIGDVRNTDILVTQVW